MKQRLDLEIVRRGLVTSRSQAESYIRLKQVEVNGKVVSKTGAQVSETDTIALTAKEQYVSRAGLKLASVAEQFKLDFRDKTVLDVGSSTGGFTDYALRHGAHKVVAVEVGTNQLHPSLHGDPRIELHEQTDIRDVYSESRVKSQASAENKIRIDSIPDIVVIDVSFISLREILPHIHQYLAGPDTLIVAMAKPQFEAGADNLKHKGVIKNDRMRRDILQSFEQWTKQHFVTREKADSAVSGEKGNLERFYLLYKQ